MEIQGPCRFSGEGRSDFVALVSQDLIYDDERKNYMLLLIMMMILIILIVTFAASLSEWRRYYDGWHHVVHFRWFALSP